jgi:hypothetical protein
MTRANSLIEVSNININIYTTLIEEIFEVLISKKKKSFYLPH